MELPLDPSSSLPFGIVESSIESCSTESDDARRQIDFSSVYTVGEKLGSGTFGNVHRCTHRVTREERAVKIIDLTSLTPNQKKRSIDEARVSACEDSGLPVEFGKGPKLWPQETLCVAVYVFSYFCKVIC